MKPLRIWVGQPLPGWGSCLPYRLGFFLVIVVLFTGIIVVTVDAILPAAFFFFRVTAQLGLAVDEVRDRRAHDCGEAREKEMTRARAREKKVEIRERAEA